MTGPELLRLARALGADADELGFLADADPADLRELRLRISDHLFERNRRQFERAVALGDRIPVALGAKLAERAMGPVLAGRAAALLSADRAVEFARRLSPTFLAEVARYVDLRRVAPLLDGMPVETMAAAGETLREREEWIVIAAFVGHVDEAKLERLLIGFDGEALLRIGFVVEDPERLDGVVALVGDERLDALVEAAEDRGLWYEAIALAAALGVRQRVRFLDAIERADGLARLARHLRSNPDLMTAAAPLVEAKPELAALLDDAKLP